MIIIIIIYIYLHGCMPSKFKALVKCSGSTEELRIRLGGHLDNMISIYIYYIIYIYRYRDFIGLLAVPWRLNL